MLSIKKESESCIIIMNRLSNQPVKGGQILDVLWRPTSRSRRGRMKLKISSAQRATPREHFAPKIVEIGPLV